jgi:hypothetical protein
VPVRARGPARLHALPLIRRAAAGDRPPATTRPRRTPQVYAGSKAWRKAFAAAADRQAVCARSGKSLCAADSQQSASQRAQLLVATSPQAYDARSAAMAGGFSAVGPPKDQQACTACVAFAILAAVQSAVASALHKDATSSLSEQARRRPRLGGAGAAAALAERARTAPLLRALRPAPGALAPPHPTPGRSRAYGTPPAHPTPLPQTPQDFFFCKGLSLGERRTCDSSWSMRDGVLAFIQAVAAKKYPVTEA